MKKLLWLDDSRDPKDPEIDWLVFSPIGRDCEVVWVKNYTEFVDYLDKNGLPDGICFDHDLGEKETGYDCAWYLVNFCIDHGNIRLPEFNIQSANPVGKENIKSLLGNYKKKIESLQ